MPDITLTYREKFLKRQLQYDRKFKIIFNKVIDDFAQLANDPNAKFTKAFRFNGVINKKIDIIIESFQKEALSLTELEIEKSWGLSNSKNDEIVKDYINSITEIKTAQKAAYFLPNIPALKAFISNKRGVATLSESIWEYAAQLRGELQIHLGLGILNGDSASVLSRRIRKYLKDPESYFRRVRDKNGKLVASKAMKANAPGQGKYNSAFKNALRVARTNANQSFQLADSIRWRQLDMVIGIEIKLSAQHPEYNYPEICELLAGIYPKEYIFIGNHPQCLCIAIPILMPRSDFKEYLKGNKPLKAEQITEYPPNFKEFWKDNYDRFSNYKTMPFIMEDNLDAIKKAIK
jgi:hypothetical protein